MYNLHVKLPTVVRVASGQRAALAANNKDITKSGITNVDKEDKLLKTQLLAARQKEISELVQLQQLVNKIYLEIKNHSEQELNYLNQVHNGIATLAMAIANKIIFTKAEVDRSFIAQIVNNTLKSTNNEQYFVIQINPEDKENLEKYWEEILKENNNLSKLAIEESVAVKRGGCVIKTPNGTIDAQIENQLAILEEAIMQKYSGLVYEQR